MEKVYPLLLMGMAAGLVVVFMFIAAQAAGWGVYFVFYSGSDNEIQLWVEQLIADIGAWVTQALVDFWAWLEWLQGVDLDADPNIDAYKAAQAKP